MVYFRPFKCSSLENRKIGFLLLIFNTFYIFITCRWNDFLLSTALYQNCMKIVTLLSYDHNTKLSTWHNKHFDNLVSIVFDYITPVYRFTLSVCASLDIQRLVLFRLPTLPTPPTRRDWQLRYYRRLSNTTVMLYDIVSPAGSRIPTKVLLINSASKFNNPLPYRWHPTQTRCRFVMAPAARNPLPFGTYRILAECVPI